MSSIVDIPQTVVTPVIMCGGSGTRLWPISRESMPKQFVRLVGSSTTFQQVLARVSDKSLFATPIVITHADFRFVVAEQIRAMGAEAEIVLEPVRRDSGPAVAVAVELTARRSPGTILLVLAADHVMDKPHAFVAACREALSTAVAGRIVTFGIEASKAETSYGYIRPGDRLNGSPARVVEAFYEKPDPETAVRYMADRCLWNSGNFMFRADVMQRELARFEPEIARAARAAVEGATPDLDFLRLAEQPFAEAPKKSIDYAVMERTSLAAVLPVDFGWSDIGSWDAIWEVAAHDSNGNVLDGPIELLETHDSFVYSDTIVTAVIGCERIVVVATPDAVLVAARDRAQSVRQIVDLLKQKNRREATEHRRIYRPWGYFQSVDTGDRYQVKRIVVKPGGRLSLQKHFHRSEHWVVVKGTAEVTNGTATQVVHENESIYVPIGSVHRLANPGRIPLELIEVQVGSYLGEDDIVRIEDVYQRQ